MAGQPLLVRETIRHASQEELAKASREQRCLVMERLNFRNGCHFFTACRPERYAERYKIDFSTDESVHYIPMLRYRCSVNGNRMSRHNWSLDLSPEQSAVAGLIDGRRSIHEIGEMTTLMRSPETSDCTLTQASVKAFIKGLWELDFLAMELKL